MSVISEPLVLKVFRQDNWLSMGLSRLSELSSTLRHYSQCPIVPQEIDKYIDEINLSLARATCVPGTDSGAPEQLKKTAQLLWAHLLSRQVQEQLRSSAETTLVFSLDEELIHIPWELLHDGRDFLCLRFNLGRLVRTKKPPASLRYRQNPARLKMLILADPNGDLKSAYQEGINIRNQLERRRRQMSVDFKSTRIDSLYLKKSLHDYDIVHFAGHCEYDASSPAKSGWVLSDGRFTAGEIIRLGQSLPLPALVFSNSCHSAEPLRDESGSQQAPAYSLAASFLLSGVRHYIGTIRRLRDDAGVLFAGEFYNRLAGGRPMGECLRLARLALVKKYGRSSGLWADYLLYGDPGFSFFASQAKVQLPSAEAKARSKSAVLRKVIAAAGTLLLLVYLYIRLPTLNPGAYGLFLNARQLVSNGRNEQAVGLLERSINKDPYFLQTYPLAAEAAQRLGRYSQALQYYFAYSLQSQKKQDRQAVISAYLGIGWIYQRQGNYPRAEEFYRRALEMSVESKDKLNQARSLRKLAVWYLDKEDYNQALELLVRSCEINQQKKRNPLYRYNLACDYFDLAMVFSNKDDFATARDFYQRSRSLFEKLKLKAELSDYYFNLGEVCLFEKKHRQALDYYLKGLKIDLRHQNLPNLVADYNMLGELYRDMDDQAEAERYFNQAVSLAKQIDASLEIAESYHNLGLLYRDQGRKNKAREFLRLAQEIYSRIDTPEYGRLKEELLILNGN
jgi:tetratricopeptide (TPR) repeat protein/CHAT domain-containing protein